MRIRPLRPEDDRDNFSSGDLEIDRFFKHYAGQNQFRHHIGTTYVACNETTGEILGFATLVAGQLDFSELPETKRKKLPSYPLPALRLARLGVDLKARDQGIGRQLLAQVCTLAVSMADQFGCIGVVVDAKEKARDFYAKLSFVPIAVEEGLSPARPQPTPIFLSIAEIKEAAGRQS